MTDEVVPGAGSSAVIRYASEPAVRFDFMRTAPGSHQAETFLLFGSTKASEPSLFRTSSVCAAAGKAVSKTAHAAMKVFIAAWYRVRRGPREPDRAKTAVSRNSTGKIVPKSDP